MKGDDGRDFVSGWQFNYFARLLAELHRLPEAARYADLAIARSKGSPNPWMLKGVLLMRVGIYREMGDTRHAEQMLARVEPTIQKTPQESAYLALAAFERALLAQARGDLPAALTQITRALSIVEGNPHSSSMPRYLTRRALILLDMGSREEARLDANRAVGIARNSDTAGPGSTGLGRAWLALGRVLLAQGKHDEARAALSSAIEHLTPSLGAEHPETRQARQIVSLPSLHPAVAGTR